MNRFTRKVKEVGWKNTLIGFLKRLYYKSLRKKYQFDPWHDSPYELRKYAQATAEYINRHGADTVVDIGCGLGEVLRNISAPQRIGLDECGICIEVAKKLDKTKRIQYVQGSFNDLKVQDTIDYVITLGFMHGSREDIWKSAYHRCASENDAKAFIVDVLPESDSTYCLDFSLILPENYVLKEKMGPFLSGRWLYVYEKTE
ncbi:MAG: class I SAM-dependent methyltransferase [Lachnospiraceae bacterium]|nr:class I SAM-dependent methyltransferase [Lachnospiraceae bacterium]